MASRQEVWLFTTQDFVDGRDLCHDDIEPCALSYRSLPPFGVSAAITTLKSSYLPKALSHSVLLSNALLHTL